MLYCEQGRTDRPYLLGGGTRNDQDIYTEVFRLRGSLHKGGKARVDFMGGFIWSDPADKGHRLQLVGSNVAEPRDKRIVRDVLEQFHSRGLQFSSLVRGYCLVKLN